MEKNRYKKLEPNANTLNDFCVTGAVQDLMSEMVRNRKRKRVIYELVFLAMFFLLISLYFIPSTEATTINFD